MGYTRYFENTILYTVKSVCITTFSIDVEITISGLTTSYKQILRFMHETAHFMK